MVAVMRRCYTEELCDIGGDAAELAVTMLLQMMVLANMCGEAGQQVLGGWPTGAGRLANRCWEAGQQVTSGESTPCKMLRNNHDCLGACPLAF